MAFKMPQEFPTVSLDITLNGIDRLTEVDLLTQVIYDWRK